MKPMATPRPEDSDKHLNAVLGTRLRSTSPEFDRRFEDLCRRLANEESAPVWLRWWRTLRHPEAGGLRVAAATAVMVALVTVVTVRYTHYASPEPDDTKAFLELVALDESLSPALALTDPEALDVLLYMPIN